MDATAGPGNSDAPGTGEALPHITAVCTLHRDWRANMAVTGCTLPSVILP